MSESSGVTARPLVTKCVSRDQLAAASALFNAYRHKYGQPSDDDDRAAAWLSAMVDRKLLTVYTAAFAEPGEDASPIGLATAQAVPASLAMGEFWQLRDLFVLPHARRHGAAAALVDAVSSDARAAGASRVSLVTEPENQAALALYRRHGFRPVEGRQRPIRATTCGMGTIGTENNISSARAPCACIVSPRSRGRCCEDGGRGGRI